MAFSFCCFFRQQVSNMPVFACVQVGQWSIVVRDGWRVGALSFFIVVTGRVGKCKPVCGNWLDRSDGCLVCINTCYALRSMCYGSS